MKDGMNKIKLHPKIWTHVEKMYQQYYYSNYKNVLISLLGIDEKDANYDIFNKLNLKDGLLIIKDILNNSDIKRDKDNNWNDFGDFICDWRPQLIEYLLDDGIIYDEKEKTFSLDSSESIPLIVTKGQLSKLINIDFSDIFYNELRDEINGAYNMGLFTSVMLLSRKLFENHIIDILRVKYPPCVAGNLELYFMTNEGRFQNFTTLLKNIEDRKSDFTVDEHVIAEIISLIKPFRKSANLNAHSIIIVSNEKGILDFQIPRISALLSKLHSNIKYSV